MDDHDQIEYPPPLGWKGSYGGAFTPESIEQYQNRKEKLAKAGRELWRQLFTEIETLDQLAAWEDQIPAFGCSCKRFYLNWKSANQPLEVNGEIPFEWKWALKSAVNQKLGHADLSLEEARQFWLG